MVGRYRKDCCKVVQSMCKTLHAMFERLFETFATSNSKSFIFHVGTNDLKFENSSKAIAKEIMNIAVSLKIEAHDVSVCNIGVRTDNQQLNLKAFEVINHLTDFCKEMIFVFFES